MFCTDCGKRLSDEDRFCPNCGKRIPASAELPHNQEPSRTKSIDEVLEAIVDVKSGKGFITDKNEVANVVMKLPGVALECEEMPVVLIGADPMRTGGMLVTNQALHLIDEKGGDGWHRIRFEDAIGFRALPLSTIYHGDTGRVRIVGGGKILTNIFVCKKFFGGGSENAAGKIDTFLTALSEEYNPGAYSRPENAATFESYIELKGRSRIGIPQATIGLIGLCSLVYLIEFCRFGIDPSAGDLLEMGADCGKLSTFGGEYWRLLTGCFLHVNPIHFGLNMWCLWEFGRLLEKMAGTKNLLVSSVATGIGGGLFSTIAAPDVVSVGVSGIVFGFVGCIIVYGWRFMRKEGVPRYLVSDLIERNIIFILANLGFAARANSSLNASIDIWAHVGGLISGVIIGWCVSQER